MSEASASLKTSKTDLYRTPKEAITPIIKVLSDLRNKRILDPCEGDGRIKEMLRSIDISNSVTGFDLFPTNGKDPVNFLEHKEKYDYIIGNPPFSIKGEFIDHALEISEYVIFVLNMNTVSYNIFHSKYLNRPEYMGRILMTPKIFMNSEGTFKPGGSAAYAWFIWRNGNNTVGSFEHYVDIRNLK